MNSLSSQPFLKMCQSMPVDHRDVGAGADAHILGRMRGGAGQARIDDDEVRAVELLAFEQVLQRHRMRLRRIAAHDDHGLGVADVVVAVGHRAVAPGIGHAGDGGRMADARLVIDVVGAPERRELAVEIGALVGELGRAEPVDRIRPGLLADRHELVADLVDRLCPRSARVHWPLTSFIGYFSRRSPCTSSRTAAPLAQCEPRLIGDVPAGLLADPHAVRDFGHDRAADRAVRADVLADGDLRRRRGGGGPASALRTLPSGSAPSAARPPATRPERRRKARRSSAAVRLALQRGGERAAARLTFRSLDQHGCSPSARIPVDAIEGLHVLGFAGSAPCASRRCSRCRRARRRRAAPAAAAATVAPAPSVRRNSRRPSRSPCVLFSSPSSSSCSRLRLRRAHDGSAKASVSISMNTRPSVPTRR